MKARETRGLVMLNSRTLNNFPMSDSQKQSNFLQKILHAFVMSFKALKMKSFL